MNPTVFHPQGSLTFTEEGADHEAKGDGGDGKTQQEDQHQGGVTAGKHCYFLLHLQDRSPKPEWRVTAR